MCKAINTCPSAIQLIPERYKTQEMCEKAIDIWLFVFDSAPCRYDTQ